MPLTEGSPEQPEGAALDHRIVVFRLDGPLFFGAAHRFLLELTPVLPCSTTP